MYGEIAVDMSTHFPFPPGHRQLHSCTVSKEDYGKISLLPGVNAILQASDYPQELKDRVRRLYRMQGREDLLQDILQMPEIQEHMRGLDNEFFSLQSVTDEQKKLRLLTPPSLLQRLKGAVELSYLQKLGNEYPEVGKLYTRLSESLKSIDPQPERVQLLLRGDFAYHESKGGKGTSRRGKRSTAAAGVTQRPLAGSQGLEGIWTDLRLSLSQAAGHKPLCAVCGHQCGNVPSMASHIRQYHLKLALVCQGCGRTGTNLGDHRCAPSSSDFRVPMISPWPGVFIREYRSSTAGTNRSGSVSGYCQRATIGKGGAWSEGAVWFSSVPDSTLEDYSKLLMNI